MTIKVCVVAIAALAAWGLKYHYAVASADDLRWILWPAAQVTGVMTGTTFLPSPGEGYLSHERLFLIEKSCAGINFMIAAFGMLVMAGLWRVDSAASALGALGASLVAAYPAAVIVNAARIAIAMWLAAHPGAWAGLDAGQVHRIAGVVVYFGGLLLLHAMAQRLGGGARVMGAGRCPARQYRRSPAPSVAPRCRWQRTTRSPLSCRSSMAHPMRSWHMPRSCCSYQSSLSCWRPR